MEIDNYHDIKYGKEKVKKLQLFFDVPDYFHSIARNISSEAIHKYLEMYKKIISQEDAFQWVKMDVSDTPHSTNLKVYLEFFIDKKDLDSIRDDVNYVNNESVRNWISTLFRTRTGQLYCLIGNEDKSE